MNPEFSSPGLSAYETAVLITGLFCLAHMVFRRHKGADREQTWELSHWDTGLLDFGLVIVFIYLLVFASNLLTLQTYTMITGNDSVPLEHQFFYYGFSMHLSILAGFWGLHWYYRKSKTIRLSLVNVSFVTLLIRSIYLLFALIPVFAIAGTLWLKILEFLNLPTEPQELVLQVGEMASTLEILGVAFLIIVLVPISEELLFRGFIYRNLKAFLPGWWPLIVSSLMFAGMHLNWLSFLPLFLLGIWLCRSYEKTGNILTPITIHGLFNGNTLLLVLLREG